MLANVYLEEVLEQQAKVDAELRPRKAALSGRAAPAPIAGGETLSTRTVDYRIEGTLWWRTVVVPPNVYVIHTRRGHDEPIHIGLGRSFRFNPYRDAFLVIPAAMQTIVINANCICRERQGVLVQAYVQWIIDDIRTAYRKLDFSDPEDPMRVVNVQLREQAEAAIKDKVATMGIDEVLADKQPIIEELTLRLRAVAEGSRDGGDSSGLGLKIVTVQIKEAVVSSARLWENLQAPFRAERERIARTAELQAKREITAWQLRERQERETAELEVENELARQRARAGREHFDAELAEQVRRQGAQAQAERGALREANETAKARKEAELELALTEMELDIRRLQADLVRVQAEIEQDAARAEQEHARAEADVATGGLRHAAQVEQQRQELALFRLRREIENDLSDTHLRAQLVAQLPQIAGALPAPSELRVVSITPDAASGSTAPLLGLVGAMLGLLDGQRRTGAPAEELEEDRPPD